MWKALFLVVAASGLATADAAQAGTAFDLRQVLGKGDALHLVVSEQGSSATETRGKTRTGVVMSYDDGRVFSLDYANRAYSSQSTAQAVAALKQERGLVRKMEIEVPARDGRNEPVLQFPTTTPLDLKAKIAGLAAHAYALHQQDVKTPVRLWFADDLPAPPAAIAAQAGGVVTVPLTTKRVLLRDETQVGGRWVTGLDTVSATKVDANADTFAPPRGWRQVKAPRSHLRSIPARPIRGVGPISARPDVFALYWNGPFSPSFTAPTNGLLSAMVGGGSAISTYWSPLGQYGVGRGAFIGSSPIAYPMPANVGTWNFFSVEGMVSTAFFTTPVPKIWWRVGARDPIIAITIPGAAVSVGGWSGYHMVNLSLGAFLPWPVSMAAHPEIPWIITKASATTGPPTVTTTMNLSHELVETASDPLPLSANTDFTKAPPWTGGEIADICSVGAPAPLPTIFKFGFTLSRYWSNAAGTCVG